MMDTRDTSSSFENVFVHGNDTALSMQPSTERVQTGVKSVLAAKSGFCLNTAKIAIIDDEELNIEVVRGYLAEAGYKNFATTMDARKALDLIRDTHPDTVLLDIKMPHINGLEILAAMRAEENLVHIPVVVLTACTDAETKCKALELGPSDFLAKPVDPSELLLRLRNVLMVKAYHDHLASYSQLLEEQVRKRTAELAASRQQIIHCLARAGEFHDDDTGHHVIRVGLYAGVIGRALGYDEKWAKSLEQAAQLHDIGKIGVPDTVLLKTGELAPDEYDLIRRHCDFGSSIIQPMSSSRFQLYQSHAGIGSQLLDIDGYPIMEMAATIAQTHHEKWNGTGYPQGLAGEDIPIEGRITAVADVYDALSSERPYKPAFSREKCLKILMEGRGAHFDPEVLDAFFNSLDEITTIQIRYTDIEQA
jgi:putative two-component system response regulator